MLSDEKNHITNGKTIIYVHPLVVCKFERLIYSPKAKELRQVVPGPSLGGGGFDE
jgi:hypothetical protein